MTMPPATDDATRVLVLMYHRLGAGENAWERRYSIAPALFARHLEALATAGYRAIAADALFAWLEGGKAPPPKSFVMTFDDGFKALASDAAPLLAARGWPYTVFLVSDLIGGVDEWTRTSNPSGRCYPLLDLYDIREMQKTGATFHSHTRRHRSLVTLDDDALADELRASRSRLQDLLASPVDYVAYPFGHTDARVEAAAREAGYRGGYSTQPGFNRRSVDRFRIRRLDIAGDDTPAMLLRKMRFGSNDGTLTHSVKYYLSRLWR